MGMIRFSNDNKILSIQGRKYNSEKQTSNGAHMSIYHELDLK